MKKGIVLEGGALRSIYTSGVCDALLEGNVMPDYLVGVSAGIAYGVSYLSRQSRRNLEVVTRYAPDSRYMGLHNLKDPENMSYFGRKFVFETIPNELVPFDYDTFAAFPGQVEAGLTNLNTGKADFVDVPRSPRFSFVLQASCAMPLMFPVYRIGGEPYLDGGVADAVPWKHALEKGCDRLIVVLSRPQDFRRTPDSTLPLIRKKYRKFPAFVAAMEDRADRYNEDREELFEAERQGKVLIFAPKSVLGVSRTERDPEKLRMLWAAGYQDAVERMDEVRMYFAERLFS